MKKQKQMYDEELQVEHKKRGGGGTIMGANSFFSLSLI